MGVDVIVGVGVGVSGISGESVTLLTGGSILRGKLAGADQELILSWTLKVIR